MKLCGSGVRGVFDVFDALHDVVERRILRVDGGNEFGADLEERFLVVDELDRRLVCNVFGLGQLLGHGKTFLGDDPFVDRIMSTIGIERKKEGGKKEGSNLSFWRRGQKAYPTTCCI